MSETRLPYQRQHSVRWQVYVPLAIIILLTLAGMAVVVLNRIVTAEEESVRNSHRAFTEGRIELMQVYVDILTAATTSLILMPESLVQEEPRSVSQLHTTLPLLDELVRLDAQGDVLVAVPSDAQLIRGDYRSSPWFVKPRGTEPYTSPLEFDRNNQAYVVTSNRTLDNGTFAMRLDIEPIYSVFVDAELAAGGNSYVIASSGLLLAHPDRELSLAMLSIADTAYYEDIVSAEGFSFLGTVENFQGEQVVVSAAPLPFPDWYMVTEVPESEAYATSNTAARVLLGTGVVIVVVSGLSLAVLLGRFVFGPLKTVSEGTAKIAAGDFSVRLTDPARGELALLQQSFNTMATDLERHDAQIRAQNEELSATNAELRKADRLKDEFLATMSHELRTPLNAIQGFSKIMLGGLGVTLDEKAHHMVQKIANNGDRLTELITSMLDFSRLQSGQVKLHWEVLAVAELLDAWRDTVEVLAAQQGLQLVLSADEGVPPTIKTDRDALTKIVVNLLSNAIKFTEAGSVSAQLSRQHDHLLIAVKDTGIGIAPEAQQLIFEEFRQADGSSTRAYGGTGLGLAIVLRLVTLLGGEIRLESTLDVGSTFTVRLPLFQETDRLEPSEDTAPSIGKL